MVMAKRIAQGDVLQVFGTGVCNYDVGESAAIPGEIKIVQYGALCVGGLSPDQARKLAAALIAAADAMEAK